jgi:glycine oxidase
MAEILTLGAGISGLWQALTLARAGHKVRLIEQSETPFAASASYIGGAMLAPFCEGEGVEPMVEELGVHGMELWHEVYPAMKMNGTLVVAQARDLPELGRFARMTTGHETLDGDGIAKLEPSLGGRYNQGLYYPREAHVEPWTAMPALLEMVRKAGVRVELGVKWTPEREKDPKYAADYIIDCRGLGTAEELPSLRGVRGEMIVVETDEVTLSRPVRLLHPRFPLYVVPWEGNRFMVGATVIESADRGPMKLRSMLDLCGLAYTLHPAFAEARIVHYAADTRPAFPNNAPRIIVQGHRIHVNGFYRHGFLLGPSLAELVAAYIKNGTTREDVFIADLGEWTAANH